MNRGALGAGLGLVLAATAISPAQAERRRVPVGIGTANPSVLVATEIAMERMTREKGHVKAVLKYADDAAVMFAPGPVVARSYLSGQKEPALSSQSQTHQVWMSCDGTLGVTRGGWQQAGGPSGYYVTIWKRQKKGTYRWVLDQGDTLTKPLEAPEMLSASVADCPRPSAVPGMPPPVPDQPIVVEGKSGAAASRGSGRSDDGTLTWSYVARPDNSHKLVVSLRKGGEMRDVVSIDFGDRG